MPLDLVAVLVNLYGVVAPSPVNIFEVRCVLVRYSCVNCMPYSIILSTAQVAFVCNVGQNSASVCVCVCV